MRTLVDEEKGEKEGDERLSRRVLLDEVVKLEVEAVSESEVVSLARIAVDEPARTLLSALCVERK